MREGKNLFAVAIFGLVFVGFAGSVFAQVVQKVSPSAGVASRGGVPVLGLPTRPRVETVEAGLDAGPPIYPTHPYYYGYAPWWRLPQSVKYKRYYYPHPGHNEPRLGLYNYDPYSWQMGLQLPRDGDPRPWYTTGYPPYEGMVARVLRTRVESDRLQGSDGALELMKAGKYRQAGLLLADGFRNDNSPRYPLLLTEVFVSLRKYPHAQLLLEEALRSQSVTDYLPRNVAAHFPSQEDFDTMLKGLLDGQGPISLLQAYYLLHSKTPDAGLEILRRIVSEEGNPASEAAGILYRHYLGQAFKAASGEEK